MSKISHSHRGRIERVNCEATVVQILPHAQCLSGTLIIQRMEFKLVMRLSGVCLRDDELVISRSNLIQYWIGCVSVNRMRVRLPVMFLSLQGCNASSLTSVGFYISRCKIVWMCEGSTKSTKCGIAMQIIW